jgi:putative protease
MVPKSVLNDLRRQIVAKLLEARATGERPRTIHAGALDELRREISALPIQPPLDTPRLYVLARSLDQLDAVLAWSKNAPVVRPSLVYCDFEDVRRYHDAVARARAAEMPVGLATLRIQKPGEEGLLRQIGRCHADAVLVRNLASVAFFRQQHPDTPLVGDFSLNLANELSVDLFRQQELVRMTPSYDLNWEQLIALLGRIDPGLFEVVIHQHIPMFHMEHCVFAATMSGGKDWRDCGRPCDRHKVELHDRAGAAFPLVADTGCRNTVYNSVAQSAAEYVPRMLAQGLRHYRVELLREPAGDISPLLDRYSRVLAGLDDGRSAWRGLQILNQLGVTRGTLQMS